MEVYFSLGTNQGDRYANMLKALELLDQKLGVHFSDVSSFLETDPWGFVSDGKFLNAAVKYDLPENLSSGRFLLGICKDIEYEMGRRGKPMWDDAGKRIYTDRPIDIDILFIGTERIDAPDLVVPHKGIAEREFVMVPLAQIISENIRGAFSEIFQGK